MKKMMDQLFWDFYKGYYFLFACILTILSIGCFYIMARAGNMDSSYLFIPLFLPSLFTFSHVIALVNREFATVYNFLPIFLRALYGSSVPLLIVHALLYAGFYTMTKGEEIGKEIIFFFIMSYIFVIIVAVVTFMLIIIPVYALRSPEIVLEGTELEEKQVSHRKWLVFSVILALNFVIWIGPSMAAFTLGFDSSMLFRIDELTYMVKEELIILFRYHTFEWDGIIWLAGIISMYASVFYLLHLFLVSLLKGKLVRVKSLKGKTILSHFLSLILLCVLYVGAINGSNIMTGFIGEDLNTDIIYQYDQSFEKEDEILDHMIQFLDEIKWVDYTPEEEELSFMLRQSSMILGEEPTYSVQMSGFTLDGIDARLMFTVRTDTEFERSKITEEFEEVRTKDDELIFVRYPEGKATEAFFFEDGKSYNILFIDPDDESVAEEEVLQVMEQLSMDYEIKERVRNRAEEMIEKTKIRPNYFPGNIHLFDILVTDQYVSFEYFHKFDQSGLSASVRYEVSVRESSLLDDKKFKEFTLDDGTDAKLFYKTYYQVDSRRNAHNNVGHFERDGLYFTLSMKNGEAPLHDKEMTNMIKVLNSIP